MVHLKILLYIPVCFLTYHLELDYLNGENRPIFLMLGNLLLLKYLLKQRLVKAPLKYNLYTKKKIKPGVYYLEYCFTYFDGNSWRNSSKTIDFKVRNYLERNDVLIGFLAMFASVVAIIGLAVIPLINWICGLF